MPTSDGQKHQQATPHRLSLKPLSEDDALRGLLETKPPPKPEREPKPRRRKPKQDRN